VNASGKTVWEYINPYDEREGGREVSVSEAGGEDRRMARASDGIATHLTLRAAASRDDAALTARLPQQADPGRATWPERPDGRRSGGDRRRRTPWGPPGGAMGFPTGSWRSRRRPGGPGGGPGGGLFRATRLASDHPGVRHVLHARWQTRQRALAPSSQVKTSLPQSPGLRLEVLVSAVRAMIATARHQREQMLVA
jgi:hypothetical protein